MDGTYEHIPMKEMQLSGIMMGTMGMTMDGKGYQSLGISYCNHYK